MIIDIKDSILTIKDNSGLYNKNNLDIWFEGYFFIEDEFFRGEKAVNYIVNNFPSITEELKNLNGVYACLVVDNQNKKITIFNDKISFQPICWSYNKAEEHLLISEDFWNVQQEMNITEFDETSVLEFLSYRFVSGKYTLLKNIFMIEPASVYTFDYSNKEINIQKKEWYVYHVTFKGHENADKELYGIQTAIFDKYKKALGKEKIQLNLTGGLDSRYILGYLIKSNFSFVTNTFGTNQSEEIRYVKKLQKKFKFSTNNIILNDNFIKDYYNSEIARHLTKRIGFKTYYYQGYFFNSLFKNKTKTNDILLCGADGFNLGLMYKKSVHDIKTVEELAKFLVKISLVMQFKDLENYLQGFQISKETLLAKLEKRVIEQLNPNNDIYSEYYKWAVMNRERNYCDKNYLVYRDYVFPMYPNYDDNFFDFMLNCSKSELENEQVYRNSMCKYHFIDELSFMKKVPCDQRGKIKKLAGGKYNFEPSKSLYGKLRWLDVAFAEKFNIRSNYLSIPFNLIKSRSIKKWGGVEKFLNETFDNSTLLNSEMIIKSAKKNRRSFYAMKLSILSTLATFEKLLKENV